MKVEVANIDLQTLASGDILRLKTYKFRGQQGRQKTYIQANLHGAEIIGNAVIYELIKYFSRLAPTDIQGEILLVPFCNPCGVNQRNLFFSTGRYSPYDGNNWNRIFDDYSHLNFDYQTFIQHNLNLPKLQIEANFRQQITDAFKQKINCHSPRGLSFSEHYRNQLQLLSSSSNYVIDIHSSTVKAIDYLYCFAERKNSVNYFLLDYGILMNQYDGHAFDEAFLHPWLILEKKMAQAGRNIIFDIESWTLELGSGMTIDEPSVHRGFKGIINYLSAKKVLNHDTKNSSTEHQTTLIPKNNLQHYYAPQGGIIRHRLPVGTKINLGDILYQIVSFPKQNQPPHVLEIQSVDRGIIYDVSINDTVNQGEYILGIFPHV